MADASARNKADSGWSGIEQFVRCLVYPLLMYFHKPARKDEVRRLMHTHQDGIPHALAAEFLGSEFVLDYVSKARVGFTRKDAFDLLRSRIDALDYRPVETTWSNYRNLTALEWARSGKYLQEDQDSRFRTIVGLARRSNATTFLDLGANDGLFSIMCARDGRAGIATDVDEASLNKLYGFLGRHPELNITVAYAPFKHVEYCAELVLALALTHHLVLGQGLTFAEISDRFDGLAEKALITEFMPDGLGGVRGHPEPSPNPLPAGYRLENFLDALREYFAHVEVIDYERVNPLSRRILIYCEKAAAGTPA